MSRATELQNSENNPTTQVTISQQSIIALQISTPDIFRVVTRYKVPYLCEDFYGDEI